MTQRADGKHIKQIAARTVSVAIPALKLPPHARQDALNVAEPVHARIDAANAQ